MVDENGEMNYQSYKEVFDMMVNYAELYTSALYRWQPDGQIVPEK